MGWLSLHWHYVLQQLLHVLDTSQIQPQRGGGCSGAGSDEPGRQLQGTPAAPSGETLVALTHRCFLLADAPRDEGRMQ